MIQFTDTGKSTKISLPDKEHSCPYGSLSFKKTSSKSFEVYFFDKFLFACNVSELSQPSFTDIDDLLEKLSNFDDVASGGGGGGSNSTLQEVTDNGNTTTNNLTIGNSLMFLDGSVGKIEDDSGAIVSSHPYEVTQSVSNDNINIKRVRLTQSIEGDFTITFPDASGTITVNAIPITFSILQYLISNSFLVVGQAYIIVDYETRHQIDGTSNVNDNSSIEPLLCIASDPNDIFRQVYSPSNPNDIIFWDYQDTMCEDGITPRTGKIIRRIDLKFDIDTPWDFRKVQVLRNGKFGLSIPQYNVFGLKIAKSNPYYNTPYNNIQVQGCNNLKFYAETRNVTMKESVENVTFFSDCIDFTADSNLDNCSFLVPTLNKTINVALSKKVFNMISPNQNCWAFEIDNSGNITNFELV